MAEIASVAHIRAGEGILKWTLLITLVIALAIVIAGCVLVYLGASGQSEMSLFGSTVSTTSVGVIGIFCGTVLGILNTRRILKAVERLGALP